MSTNISVADLLQRNQEYALTHDPLLTLPERAAAGIPRPQILIITCADPRCVPETFMNIRGMPGAVVFRTAGGRVEPLLNGLLALDRLLTFKEIMVIHHTDCGATYFKEEQVHQHYLDRGASAGDLDGRVYGAFEDLETSVRDDVDRLKTFSLLREELQAQVTGYVFDIKTGALSPVK